MRCRADGGGRVGLLQRSLCRRKNGEAQSHCPDRRAQRPSVLWLSNPSRIQFLRRMPARGVAKIRDLAGGVRRVQRVRAPYGARARGATIRASGLFWRRRREFERRVLNLLTQHNDRQVPLSPRNSEREVAVVTPQDDIGYAAPRLQSS